MVLIDPYAMGIINQTDALLNTQILQVFLYTSLQQIIVVAVDRTILVFDAYRLDKLQTMKDVGITNLTKFTSVTFD